MAAYYIEVPDLEPQTLIHYNEIFKKVLKDVYNITPRKDWVDENKWSLDRITEFIPEEYEKWVRFCAGAYEASEMEGKSDI